MPEALCFDPGSQRGDPSIRLTADQVTALQALVSGAGNLSASIRRHEALYRWYGAVGDSGKQYNATGLSALNWTAGYKMELETDFVAVALMFVNRAPNAINANTALVGVTETSAVDTSANRVTPVIGGTSYPVVAAANSINGFRAVTAAGGSSVNVAGATLSQQFALTDYIPLSNVPRADGGTRPLLLYRPNHDGSTQGNWALVTNAAVAAASVPTAALRNRIIQINSTTGDAVATPGTSMSASTTLLECYPVVRHKVPVLSVWGVGDSNTQQNAIVADGISAWGFRACLDASTPAYPVVWSNFGASGSVSIDYLNTLENALASGAPPPSVIVSNSVCINDLGANPTARNAETGRASFFRLLSIMKRYRIQVLIAWDTQPYASLDATEDALRLALNAELRAIAASYGVTWLTAMGPGTLGDGASPERFRPAYVWPTDGLGLHWNEAANEAVCVPALAAILRTLAVL